MSEPESVPVCNIGGRGRGRRVASAVVSFAAAGGFLWTTDGGGALAWVRFGLIPVFGFGFLCLFQAMEST